MTDGQGLSPESIKRIWEHALHEERIYNDRHNFFLVAEAMLFVFYATLGSEPQTWALVAIALLGLVITAMWIMIAMRQAEDLEVAVRRLKIYCSEYVSYKKERESKKKFRYGALKIMGRWMPIAIGAAWVVLLVEVATR